MKPSERIREIQETYRVHGFIPDAAYVNAIIQYLDEQEEKKQ